MSGRLILVRHGQSHGNVARRLDTRPPGSELTELGRQQAQEFARSHTGPSGLLLHSVARRAAQTAAAIGAEWALPVTEVGGVHEVQVGELEDRDDDAAIAEFNAIYQGWHEGNLSVPMPGGESGADVLDRYLPVLSDLRTHYLDDRHWTRDIVVVSHAAAIRLVAATLAGIDAGVAAGRHLANTEAVALAPVADGGWSCLQWGVAPTPLRPSV